MIASQTYLEKPVFEAFGEWLLVKVVDPEETPGGIVVPQTNDGSMQAERGLVLEAGPGRVTEEGEFIENRIKQGDIVYLWAAMGHPHCQVPPNGCDPKEVFLLVRERQVTGRFKKANQ